jgi:hypothetical protein
MVILMKSIKHTFTLAAFLALPLLPILASEASSTANAATPGATTLPSHLNSEFDEYFPVGDPSKLGNGESRTQNILGMFDGRVGKYFNDSKYETGYSGSGLILYPRAGWTVLQELNLTAASDAPGRDPASVTVKGTKDGGRIFELIAKDLPVPPFKARKSRQSVVGKSDNTNHIVLTGKQKPTEGSTLTFYDFISWKKLGKVKVLKSKLISDSLTTGAVNDFASLHRIRSNARLAYQTVIDSTISLPKFAMAIHSDYRADSIIVRGCLFQDQVAQIMLLQGAKYGLIENNLLLRSTGGGISAQFAQY